MFYVGQWHFNSVGIIWVGCDVSKKNLTNKGLQHVPLSVSVALSKLVIMQPYQNVTLFSADTSALYTVLRSKRY